MKYTYTQNFSDTLFNGFTRVTDALQYLFKSNPQDFVDVIAGQDTTTLCMRGNLLVSAIELKGITSTQADDDFVELLLRLDEGIQAAMTDTHHMSIYFESDTSTVTETIMQEYGSVALGTAEKLQLDDLEDIIKETVSRNAQYCQKEKCFLLFWTNNRGLTNEEVKIHMRKRAERLSKLPKADGSQPIATTMEDMLVRHHGFVDQMEKILGDVNMMTKRLDAHEFLREIRVSIAPGVTSRTWKPLLPGDKIKMKVLEEAKPDNSGYFGWPSLEQQLFPQASTKASHNSISVGKRTYSPVSLKLLPSNFTPFDSLFRSLKKENVPWRVHFTIKPGGMNIFGLKSNIAQALRILPGDDNKFLLEAQEQLKNIADSGDMIAAFQATFCTWVDTDDLELLQERREKLVRAIQGWGGCDTALAEGDELESMLSSTPGATSSQSSNISASRLYELLKMMPFSRPCSPWARGSRLYRSVDGKVVPYQPFSSEQTSWITLVLAPMGFGKSVELNAQNFAFLMNSINDDIPFLSISDVGRSSKGLIDIMRDALPEDKKHYAIYKRLKNNANYTVNPCDTRLGLRYLLPVQREFLEGFLAFLCTPDGQDAAPEGVDGVVSMIVRLEYELRADRSGQFLYREGTDETIDKKLKELDFPFAEHKRLTWYDITDYFFSIGDTHMASYAQRYAVPTLPSLSQMAMDDRIQATYKNKHIDGEPIAIYINRKLNEAIERYPIIAGVTQMDLGEARIISLDLDEVAKGSARNTAIMYLFSYYVLTRNFYVHKDDLQEMEEAVGKYRVDYRPYHAKIIDAVGRLPKQFCMDEKHRSKGIVQLDQILDARLKETRKWYISFLFATQLADDFSDSFVQLATNVFILGGGSKANVKTMVRRFGLSPAMEKILNTQMVRPSKRGSTSLALMETAGGWVEQLLMSTLGPTFLWVTTTSANDTYVRDNLADAIGGANARKLLVEFYPAGNLDEEIERRKEKLLRDAEDDNAVIETDDEGNPVGITRTIINELKQTYEDRIHKENERQRRMVNYAAGNE